MIYNDIGCTIYIYIHHIYMIWYMIICGISCYIHNKSMYSKSLRASGGWDGAWRALKLQGRAGGPRERGGHREALRVLREVQPLGEVSAPKAPFFDRFQSISLGFGRLLDVFSWFSSDFSLGTALSASDENIMRVETGVEKALALRMLTCSRFIWRVRRYLRLQSIWLICIYTSLLVDHTYYIYYIYSYNICTTQTYKYIVYI